MSGKKNSKNLIDTETILWMKKEQGFQRIGHDLATGQQQKYVHN